MKLNAKKLFSGAIVLMVGLAAGNPVLGAAKAADPNILAAYVGQCITVGVEGGDQLLEFVGTLVSVGDQFLEMEVPITSGGEPTGETLQIFPALSKVSFFVPDNPFTDYCNDSTSTTTSKAGTVASRLGLSH